jgi:hypothetical protein
MGELAEQLARDTRQVMTSNWNQALFPGTRLAQARTAVHDLETTKGGGRMAVSRGGPITGRGAHIVIVDDPPQPTSSGAVLGEAQATKAINLLLRLNEEQLWRLDHACRETNQTRIEWITAATPNRPQRRQIGSGPH